MPELPEVETTRRGIAPHIQNRIIKSIVIRQCQLRWPIPQGLERTLQGAVVGTVRRRGKYLLVETSAGTLIIHLGMSGSLRLLSNHITPGKHDHVDIVFDNRQTLRLHDPRRFGAVLFTRENPATHPLLAPLGPEPLTDAFDGHYLWTRSRGRRVAIKNLLMNSHIVVGVGNIYASESLFAAGIHPQRPAGRISRQRYARLAEAVKQVLAAAIEAGGTTLRDFRRDDGRPGYFQIELAVYGRTGEPCPHCATPIKRIVTGQRATYYCPQCQH